MARQIKRLSTKAVEAKKRRGVYPDGNGLLLQVSATGAKSWIFRFKRNGKARDMGLGSLRDVTLAQARERAQAARQRLTEGLDPIEERAGQAAEKRLATVAGKEFQASGGRVPRRARGQLAQRQARASSGEPRSSSTSSRTSAR